MANFSLTNNPLAKYIRESYEELQRVTWPTRKQVIKDTLIVSGISLGVGLFFAGADFLLQEGVQRVLEL